MKYVHKSCTNMAYKTLGVRLETYDRLKAAKKKGESFSDLFDRLLDRMDRRGSIREIAGSISKEDGEELKRIVTELRKEPWSRY